MVEKEKKPIYKQWWFWAIIAFIVIAGGVGMAGKKDSGNNSPSSSVSTTTEDFTNKDAKSAYESFKSAGYDVKFAFDRANNGGFTEDGLQEFVQQEFGSSSYSETPFTVVKQSTSGKTVTLTIEYASAIKADEAQKARESALEAKLGIVESMTACRQYGSQNYQNFKMHSIVGKIAEYASDDNTWFLKYKVDANGYKNQTMECYVTGTSENPVVKSFIIY